MLARRTDDDKCARDRNFSRCSRFLNKFHIFEFAGNVGYLWFHVAYISMLKQVQIYSNIGFQAASNWTLYYLDTDSGGDILSFNTY